VAKLAQPSAPMPPPSHALVLPGPAARPWTAVFDEIRLAPSWSAPTTAARPAVAGCSWAWLPADLALAVLERLDPRALGLCATLSRTFASLVRHPRLWQRMCAATWRQRFDGRDRPVPGLRDVMLGRYGSWRGLFLDAPRVRTDGVYVSQNFRSAHSRFSTGVRGLKPKRQSEKAPGGTNKERAESYADYSRALNARIPFYRYLRFCADGRVAALDVVDTPQETIPNLRSLNRADLRYNNLGIGLYEQLPDGVYTRVEQRLKSHPLMKRTEKRSRFSYDPESAKLHLLGYHAVVDGEDVKFPLDHAPYVLVKWADASARKWPKVE
jgi:hypothetical protein